MEASAYFCCTGFVNKQENNQKMPIFWPQFTHFLSGIYLHNVIYLLKSIIRTTYKKIKTVTQQEDCMYVVMSILLL